MENSTPQSAHRLSSVLLVSLIIILLVGAGVMVSKNRDTSDGDTLTETSSSPSPSPTTTTTPSSSVSTISVKEKGTQLLKGGFADPSIARTDTGYRMYVNTFGNGPGGYLTYTSTDGITWIKEKGIIISGVATGRAVVLPTGVRFYYPGMQPINPSDPPADMFSSFSTDGLAFTKDAGVILKPRDGYYVEGPTVFQLPDNSWRMYFNENTIAAGNQRDGEIWGASSADGITWTRDAAVTLTDTSSNGSAGAWKQVLHPFVLKNPKGGYIMLYNTHSEIYAATSVDGMTWNKIGKIGVHGADADGYFQEDGTIRLFYGDFSEKDSGQVYMATLTVE